MKKTLYELAGVIRSKNSGPFCVTLDALFDDAVVYEAVKNSGAITREKVAGLYHLDPGAVREPVYFDAARGVKVTFDRKISSGTCLDSDVYGAQQHVPFGELEIDLP